jgi:aconitate hydratase 2/2-methylisocitrate dehydratase
MLNRRTFIIRSAATTAAATIAIGSQAEAKTPATKVKGKGAASSGLATIPMDDAKSKSIIFEAYRKHAAERAAMGIPPLPLSPTQTAAVAFLLRNPPKGEENFLLDLITNRVPPGVSESAKIKADFLTAIATGKDKSPLLSKKKAVELLSTMQGGYNVRP